MMDPYETGQFWRLYLDMIVIIVRDGKYNTVMSCWWLQKRERSDGELLMCMLLYTFPSSPIIDIVL